MKALFGSVVFLSSLLLMRRILIEGAVLSPTGALLFLVAAVGVPLGGVIFLETALDLESRALRRQVEDLRREVKSLRRRIDPALSEDEEDSDPA